MMRRSTTQEQTGFVGSCGDDPGNEGFGTATALTDCGVTDAGIDCDGDLDFYSFNPDVAQAKTMTFAVQNAGGGYYLTLYDSSQNVISQTSSGSLDYYQGVAETVYARVAAATSGETFEYDLSITGCSSGGCGNDPGNDDMGSATNLNGTCGTTSAAFDCVGDMDFYKFTAPNDGEFTFMTTGSTDTVLNLYDDEGGLLTFDDDGGSGGNASLTYTLSMGSTYYVSVGEYNNDGTGDYTLDVSGCSSGCGNDPGNDDMGSATDLGGSCGTTSAAIDCADDIDFYRFQAPSDATFTFDVGSTSSTNLSLYDASGGYLDQDSTTVSRSLSSGEVVYARVLAGVAGQTLSYTLEITGCSSGGCGSDPGNDDIGSATDLAGSCGAISAAFDCAGDVDFYRFTAPNDGGFTFETTGSMDTVMNLYDGSGSLLTSDDDGGSGYNASMTYTLSMGSTYYASVGEYGNDDTGGYTLDISGCSASGCGNDPGNDDIGSATLVADCGSLDAAIDCETDMDVYRFTVPSDGTYTYAAAGDATTYVFLMDETGSVVSQSTDSVERVETSGTLRYVRVEPNSTVDAPFDYTFTVSGCSGGGCGNDPGNDDAGSASILSDCGSYTAALDCSGDEDWYAFTASTTGEHTFMIQAALDAQLDLRDSAFNPLGTGTAQFPADLVSGETYYVTVFSSTDQTGDYLFQITGCDTGGCSGDGDGDTAVDATPFDDCGWMGAAFDCVGDVDYFSFTVPVAGTYTFETSGLTDTKMWLENGSGGVVAFDDDSGSGLNARIDLQASGGESLFIRLEEYNNDDTGTYEIHISGCAQALCSGDDEGNTFSTAVPLAGCGTLSAAFDCASDLDVFRFRPPRDSEYTIQTTGGRDTKVDVYDEVGTLLAFDEDSGSGSNARVTEQLSGGETVYIAVAEAGGATGSYGIAISGCDAAGVYEYVVTATAKLAGAEGTNWSSDLILLNLGEGPANVTVSLWERDQPNPTPLQTTVALSRGELRREEDVLVGLFGVNNGAAALHLSSDEPLVVGTRTFNDTGDGTYGQYIPGVSLNSAVPAGEYAYLPGLVENVAYRTNLGLVNPTDSQITVTVTLFSAEGFVIGERTFQVPRSGYVQINRVVERFTDDSVSGAWAYLTSDGSGFFPFLSVVDNGSGDPVYRPGVTLEGGPLDAVLAGVAKLAGDAGTNWVSDTTVVNIAETDATVKLRLWNRDQDNSSPEERSFTLLAGNLLSLDDVMLSLFGETSGAAALHVSGPSFVVADTRTYNLVDEGTFGQFIPSAATDDALGLGGRGFLVMVAQSSELRTNLGLTNVDDDSVDVEVRLYGADGVSIGGTKTYTLPARGVRQINKIVNKFTGQPVDAAYLEIRVANGTPDGRVHAYASVVDQVTGDPVFETMSIEVVSGS